MAQPRRSNHSPMDLLSLPQEMLASVFKYADICTLTKRRQMNCKINDTALRYGLNRLKLKILSFRARATTVEIFTKDFYGNTQNRVVLSNGKPAATLADLIECYLEGARYIGLLEIYKDMSTAFQLAIFPGNILSNNSRNRFIRGLRLTNMDHVEVTSLQRFLRTFKPYSLEICSLYTTIFLSNLLFDGLVLDKLRLSGPTNINDLKQLCSKKIPTILNLNCPETSLAEIVDFLLDVSREGKNLHYKFFAIKFGTLTDDEVWRLVAPLVVLGVIEYERNEIHIKNKDNYIHVVKKFY